jgi:hypothetical protein
MTTVEQTGRFTTLPDEETLAAATRVQILRRLFRRTRLA